MTRIRNEQITSETATDGHVLTADGAGNCHWEAPPAGTGGGALDDLSDVVITTPSSGQVLKFNGSEWVNDTDATGTGGADATAIHDDAAGEINALAEKTTLADDDLFLIEDSADGFNKKKVKKSNLPAGGSGNPGEGHVTIWPDAYNAIGQGDWGFTNNSSGRYGWYLSQTTPANGDNISFQAYLAAGTYTIMLLHHKNTSGGIMKVDVDGVEVGSVDQYAALTWNVRAVVTGIAVATSGLKTIRLRMDGKNASSSGHKGWLVFMSLWRTA
jgi:hypothetical protein